MWARHSCLTISHLPPFQQQQKLQQQKKEQIEKAARDKELQLREEEELQLALALSASEAETKKQAGGLSLGVSVILFCHIDTCQTISGGSSVL